MSKRYFEVKIIVGNDSETLQKGLLEAKQMIESFGIKSADIKPIQSKRTLAQNNALHKWCQLFAQELEEKHIDKREFFKEPFFMSWTTDGVKNDVWRPIQKSLTGKKSTTKLDKTEEINLILDNIRRIIVEKYKGEVSVPNFPHYNPDE